MDAAKPTPQPESASPLDSLEHRRDVAALVVFHKAQVQGVPHLTGLRQPLRVATRSTRTVLASGDSVEVPYSRASQHQRTFVGRVSRMWNMFTAAVPYTQVMNTHSVKLAKTGWRRSQPTPLTLVSLWHSELIPQCQKNALKLVFFFVCVVRCSEVEHVNKKNCNYIISIVCGGFFFYILYVLYIIVCNCIHLYLIVYI